MDTQELINTYHLEFVNKVIKVEGWPAEIDKWPGSISEELSNLLYSWETTHNITVGLLSEIEPVLNLSVSEGETGGGQVFADFTPSQTILYRDSPLNPLFTLPTQDFYDIIVLWRDFLLEEPRNGTLVRGGYWSNNRIFLI